MGKIFTQFFQKVGLFSDCAKKSIPFFAVFFCLVLKTQVGSGQTQIYTSSGSFTIPAGVTGITVECWGGGGAGGGADSTNLGASGGGGGAYAKSVLSVLPLSNYTVTVGAGGLGAPASIGGDGAASWFGSSSTILAPGGKGGGYRSTQPAGAGGTGGIGNVLFSGGNGALGKYGKVKDNSPTDYGYGGGGGSSAGFAANGNNAINEFGGIAPAGGGNGADGVTRNINGVDATTVGGGGSGSKTGDATNPPPARTGGKGFKGKVVLTWPVITGVSPLTGCVGNTDTITGSNLNGATSVTVGGVPATIISNTAAQIVIVMTSSASGPVKVICTYGTVTSTSSVTINALPAPTIVSGSGTYCGSVILSASNGSSGVMYFQGTTSGGTSTANPGNFQTVTASGTYYFRAFNSSTGCWGNEGSAAVVINAVPSAVTVSGGGNFCGSTTITASGGVGGTIYFQGTTAGGTSTATPSNSQTIASSGTYYFRALGPSGCWSTEGSVTVTINPVPPTPTGSSPQAFCNISGVTIANLVATGTNINWYSSPTGGSPLPSSTSLVNGTHYYASVMASGCESASRLDVQALVYQPVSIISQPVTSQTTCSTLPISFSVGTTGDVVTYQWYKNGVALTDNSNISGSQAAVLNISQAALSDAGTYYVIMNQSAPCGAVQSNNSVLTVNEAITIDVQPVPQTVCTGGTAIFTVSATGTGITYQWRKGNVNLADGGNISGVNTPTLTIANVSAADAAINYNVVMTIPGGSCPQSKSKNVKLGVNPIPAANAVANQVVCNGAFSGMVSFSGSVPGTDYNWTNSDPSIGLAASGTGNIASFKAINAGTAPVTATITVTPSYTSDGTTCTGTPITFFITVDPVAMINSVANQSLCNGDPTAAINFTSPATGGIIVYSWTNSTPSIGLPATGSGNIGSFTALNSGVSPITATITVISSYTNGPTTCISDTLSFTITVNPTLLLTSSLTPPDICSNSIFSYIPSSATSPVNFAWSRAAVPGISNAAATGNGNPNETLINTTSLPILVTYAYTLSANGCSNIQNVKVVVKPKPALTGGLTFFVCSGAPFVYTPSSGVPGVNFSWTRAAVAGISNPAGTGTGGINDTLVNTTINPISVIYTYTLLVNGCSNTQNLTVTVNPSNVSVSASQATCNNTAINAISISSFVPGTSFSWTRSNTSNITGIAASGTGTSISGTLVNNTSSTQTTVFTITATAPNGCQAIASTTVTVYASLAASVVTDNQTACVQSTPDALKATPATGGDGTYSYQWQSSTDNITWINIAGQTGLTYQPTHIFPQTPPTYYRIVITNSCSAVPLLSNSVLIQPTNDAGLFPKNYGFSDDPVCTVYSFTDTVEIRHSTSNYMKFSWSADPLYVSPATGAGAGTTVAGGSPPVTFKTSSAKLPFTVQNTTNAPVSATIKITPRLYDGSDSSFQCNATPQNTVIVINPTPQVNAVSDMYVCAGATVTSVIFTGNVTATGISYSWTSSNPAVGIAAASGKDSIPSFIATNNTSSPVFTSITVTPQFKNPLGGSTCTGLPITFKITVNPTVTMNTPDQNVCNGSTAATNFSSPATGGTIVYTWTNDNTSIGLAASGTGNIASFTAINTGSVPDTANIIVTASYTNINGGQTCTATPDTFRIIVNPTLTAGTVIGASPLCIGQTSNYISTGNTGGIWASDNTTVATVDPVTGMVTGKAAGTAHISYSITSGCAAPVSTSVPVTVDPNVTSGIISGAPSICIGSTTTYSSSGTGGGIWSSSDTTIAKVNAATGIIKGIAQGTASISYTVVGCNSPAPATKTITVNPDANAGTISSTKPSTVCIGTTDTYTSNGDAGGTWSSSNTAVATVSASGNVIAVGAGTTNIIYTINTGCNSPQSALKTLTVNPNATAGTLSGPSVPICVGAHISFSSSGDAGGTWSTSDASVATVDIFGTVTAVNPGSAIITYTVNSGCNPPASASKNVQVVNQGALLNPGMITGPSGPLCANTPGLVYSVNPVAGATYYIWTVPPGWIITGGATTNSITVTTGSGGAGTITATAGNACGFSPTPSSLLVNVSATRIWLGITMDWNNASNWCGGIPTATTDAIIPATGPGTYYLPQLTADAPVRNITIATGANIDLNGHNFTVNGAFSGTGTLSGSVTSGLIINGAAGTVYFKKGRPFNLLKTLTLSAGSSLTLGGSPAAGDTLNIVPGSLLTGYGTVSVATGGTLNSNGIIDLNSSLLATARVDLSPGLISGNVTFERYIPPNRAWRFLSVPFSSSNQSINEAWQEGKVNPDLNCANNQYVAKGYGTEITSNGVNGYDPNITTNPSIKVWVNNTWAFLNSTTTGKITDYSAYCLFVRGDRTICLSQGTSAIPNATILRTTGVLNQIGGNNILARTYSGIPVGNFLLVGNPYASAINLQNVITGSRVQGFQANKIWVWDPVLGDEGTYVTFTSGIWAPATGSYPSGTNLAPLVRNGQAFMVQANSSNVSVQFQENDKDADQVNIFGFRAGGKPGHPAIFVNLLKNDGLTVLDGVAAGFAKQFSAGIDADDAQKQWNNNENMVIMRNGKMLAIEMRPMPTVNDTLNFGLLDLKQHTYMLKVFAQNLPSTVPGRAWLIDKYLGKQKEINLYDTSYYSFVPNADTNSYRNRFMLVFKAGSIKSGKAERLIAATGTATGATIFPNPVSGNDFNLVLYNIKKDNYKVNIYNSKGNLVLTRSMHFENGNNEYNIKLPAYITGGNYTVKVMSNSGNVISTIPVIIAR